MPRHQDYKPLTVVPGTASDSTATIVVNGGSASTNQANSYWFRIIERSNLDVVFEHVTNVNDSVPEELEAITQRQDVDQLILIVCTTGLSADNIPKGELDTFLHKVGGSEMLQRMEQISSQLGTGTFSYAMVNMMGDSRQGYETLAGGTADDGVMTLELIPVEFGGKTFYSVANLGH